MNTSTVRASLICPSFAVLCFYSLSVFGQRLDTAVYTVIPYNSDMYWVFPDRPKAASLSLAEVDSAERLLHRCVDEYNGEQQRKFESRRKQNPNERRDSYIIDLKRYKRQYVCVIDKKGEKIVWINFMCEADSDWKTTIPIVADGGNCWFNLKINLAKRTYFDLMVNGDA